MRSGEVPKWKVEKVEEFKKLLKEYPVVGIVNMEGFPSRQLLQTKKKLVGLAVIKMSKKSIIVRALQDSDKKGLIDYIKGQPAIIFTKENPFKLSKFIIENKTSAPAKAGAEVPHDVVINAGETTFTPGPIVGELQKKGIKAAIEGGKVVIKEDSVIAKAGEKLTSEKAELINKLGIEPLEIGINLLAAYEDGIIFGKDVLTISTEKTISDIQSAYNGAFNLAYNIGYPTKENIELFIQKAFREAKSLALKAEYTCSATIKELLAKADAQANALKSKIPEAPASEEKPAESKEEKPTEEQPKASEEKQEEQESKPEEAKEDAKSEESK